jgi:hypothetical protein
MAAWQGACGGKGGQDDTGRHANRTQQNAGAEGETELTLQEFRNQLYALHQADVTLKLVKQKDPKAWNVAAQTKYLRALKALDLEQGLQCLDDAIKGK